MISAYEGKEPYIFVSYSHKDREEVYRVMELLAARGYRIWYDQGIEPGYDWPEDIAQHLLGAEVVLAFITKNAAESVNCRNEISFAIARSKPFLSVIMEKANMPAGVQLQISSQQSVIRYEMKNEREFIDRICECPYLKPCRGEPKHIAFTKIHSRRNRNYEIILAVSVALLLMLILAAVKGCTGGHEEEMIPEETPVIETAVPQKTPEPHNTETPAAVTAEPEETPQVTPEPAETATPAPEASAVPEPQETAVPETPVPSAEPAETPTAEPSAQTPEPSAQPSQEPSAEPAETEDTGMQNNN